jgi:uncharacterized protein (DUF4415 family)
MHEFEAFLFSNPSAYQNYGVMPDQVKEIINIKNRYETPEHINNSYETAPSKRLMKIMPQPKQGIIIRIVADVLSCLKQLGNGYQTRMNAVLRSYMDNHC